MNSDIIVYALVAIIGVFISSVSQVLLKKAAIKNYDSTIKEYFNPLVIGAYFLFICTTFISIYAYKGIPLSLGPILEATSYIYVTAFGIKIFREKVNKRKILALGFIICGIIVYSLFGL